MSGWSALLARHQNLCLAKSHTLTFPAGVMGECVNDSPSALGRISWKKQLHCWLLSSYSQGCPGPNLLGFAVSKHQRQPMHRSSLNPSQPCAAAALRRAELPGRVLVRAGWRAAGRENCRGDPRAKNYCSMAGGAGVGAHGDLGRKQAATPNFSPIHNVLKPGTSQTCRVCRLSASAGASFPF